MTLCFWNAERPVCNLCAPKQMYFFEIVCPSLQIPLLRFQHHFPKFPVILHRCMCVCLWVCRPWALFVAIAFLVLLPTKIQGHSLYPECAPSIIYTVPHMGLLLRRYCCMFPPSLRHGAPRLPRYFNLEAIFSFFWACCEVCVTGKTVTKGSCGELKPYSWRATECVFDACNPLCVWCWLS